MEQRMVEYRTEAEIQEQIIAQERAASRAEGEARGETKGMTKVVVDLLQAGLLTPEQISAATAIPLTEIEAMASGKEAAALK